jgi:hypothetical protein
MKTSQAHLLQIIWGIILILAGVGVFYRIPQVMPKMADLEVFTGIVPYIKFCFYFIGIVLFCGGIQKVYTNVKRAEIENAED